MEKVKGNQNCSVLQCNAVRGKQGPKTTGWTKFSTKNLLEFAVINNYLLFCLIKSR